MIDKEKIECYLLHGNKPKETDAKKVFDDFSFKDFVLSDMRRGGGVAKQTML